jgi:glycosyltransferase involved in cell wall biosynthesis
MSDKRELPPKIAFIAANHDCRWGGSEYCWGSAAERLVRTGAEVRISKRHWDQPIPEIERLSDLGCRVFYRRDFPPFPIRVLRKLTPRHDRNRAHLKRVGAGADLIVISQGWHYDGWQWLEAAAALGYKYCLICQGVSERWWPSDSDAERLAAAWEGASAVFFVAQANLEMTRRMLGTSLPRARVIRNPFNVSYDAQLPWPSQASPELQLAFVSRLDIPGKGYDILFEVMSKRHWRERDIRVSLFGNGPNERSIRRMIGIANLSGKIVLGGFTENIEQIWASHHALILPSRAEGMPLVLVEAMLCGRPAIITNVGGVGELLRDGANGFLAKTATVDALDDAMNRAWENRHRLKEIGEQATIDVRKVIPPDPTEDFVAQLRTLAESSPEKVKQQDASVAQNLRRNPVL